MKDVYPEVRVTGKILTQVWYCTNICSEARNEAHHLRATLLANATGFGKMGDGVKTIALFSQKRARKMRVLSCSLLRPEAES